MAQTLINIRMDENLKKDMERTCQLLGMNITTAFTIFAKKMSREQRIPFEISIDPFFCESNQNFLKDAISALDAGKGEVHELIEAD